jgi:hypothetical protein
MLDGFLKNILSSNSEFQLKDLKILSMNLNEIQLGGRLLFKNTYPVELPPSDIDLKISIENTHFSNIKTAFPKISKDSSVDSPFELKIPFTFLTDFVLKFPKKEEYILKVEGLVSFDLPEKYKIPGKESVDFRFVEEKGVPSFVPVLELQNFQMKVPEPSNVLTGAIGVLTGQSNPNAPALENNFQLKLINKGSASIQWENLDYKMDLASEKFLEGKSQKAEDKGIESFLEINNRIPLIELGKNIMNALKTKTSPYKFYGKSGLKFNKNQEIIQFNYQKDGTIKW